MYGMMRTTVSQPATDLTTRPATPCQATVLIVDDCANDRELSFHALQDAGYRILQTYDAQQAQRLVEEVGNIDLLVTDFNLPGMNGVELARWFHLRFPLHEVLLVSDSPGEFEAWIKQADWLHFLNKGVILTRLDDMVEKLLGKTNTQLRQSENGIVPIKGDSKQPRILVAEDEPDIRRFYSEMLGAEGYQVDAVADGEAAWNLLQIKPYALVITDKTMPRMSGPDLFRTIRANGMMLPVILATGTLPVNDEGLPFDAVLSKPFVARKLVETVNEILKSPDIS
jgi:CheY-like chemotaxis protein